MRKKLILSAALCTVAFPTGAYAQAREVAGKVREAATGRPVPNAAVAVVGQEVGACTSERGEYRLRVPEGEVSIVVRVADFEPGLVRLSASDAAADFAMERQILPAAPTNEPIVIVSGVPRWSTPAALPVSAPDEPILVVDGIPLWSTAFACSEGRLIRSRGGAN